MLRKSLLVFFILSAAILIGCSKTETGNTNTASSNTGGSSASSNSSGSSTTAAADKTGVPECDDYIAKYESCVRSHVPEAQRAAMESAFKTARDGYKKAAETPQGKASLAGICKQASDAAAASMKAYGCSF